MARNLGSPLLLFSVWILMGIIAASGAICYGRLASRYPEAGGAYVYLREAYGDRIAFLYGWMSLLIMDPGVTAALSVGLVSYLAVLLPIGPWGARALAIFVIWGLAALNILNTRTSASLLQFATWAKIAVLVAVPAWAVIFGLGGWSNLLPFATRRPGSPPLFGALAAGLMAAFFSFGGWWDASKLSGEVRNPAKNLPRAFVLGVGIVTLVYVLVSGAFLYLLPLERVINDQAFVAEAGTILFGRIGGELLALVVAGCIVGSLAALIMSAPRVYFAMARDGAFPSSAAEVHPRFGTPYRAILVQAVMASILVLSGKFESIIAYFMFTTVAFVGLTVLSALRGEAEAKPFLAALLFSGLILVVLILLLARYPIQCLVGTAIVLLGLPVRSMTMRNGSARISQS
jgi:APA family basic amino acid/polyamine antiporter